jgi:acyl-CoA synthetase (AMP-forming)/AMP-acid ligase II
VKNLAQCIERPVASVPQRSALICGERQTSYAELGRAVERAAASLAARGVGRGARVALIDDAGLLLLATVLGAARIGAAAVPLHTQLTAAELSRVMELANCAPLGVAGEAYAAKLSEALGRPALLEADLLAPSGPAAPALAGEGADDCLVLLTSGTTGLPKPVGISHASMAVRIAAYAAAFDPGAPVQCSLMSSPGVHIGGLGGMLVGVAGGATIAVMTRFEAGEWLRMVERHRANTAFLVPTMLRRILDHPRFDQTDLSSLTSVSYGAAAAPVELVEEMIRRFPKGVAYANVFGQTETTGAITAFGPADHVLDERGRLLRAGSVGKPLPGVELRILELETGEPVKPGEPGELWVRSAYNAQDGWRQTGDIVRQDADGYVYPQGRLSDTINRGGEKFGPSEIEDVLRLHPDVVDAAVAGLPDREMGERVGAAIVARRPLTLDEVRAHCARHLARFKAPEKIALVSEIPRTAMWKVSRKAIAELVQGAG